MDSYRRESGRGSMYNVHAGWSNKCETALEEVTNALVIAGAIFTGNEWTWKMNVVEKRMGIIATSKPSCTNYDV